MINKYRVHEVAKDFDIKSNIVVDLLAKYFDGQKKHMTALEEDELDIIFDTFTKEHEVADLNEYFEFTPAPKKAKAEEKPAEEPDEAPAEKPAPAPEKKAEKAPEKKPEKKAEPAKKAEDKKPAEKKEQKPQSQKPAQQGKADKLPPMPKKQQNPEVKDGGN